MKERLEEYERLARAYPDFVPRCRSCTSLDLLRDDTNHVFCKSCCLKSHLDDCDGRLDYPSLVSDLQKAVLDLVEQVRMAEQSI